MPRPGAAALAVLLLALVPAPRPAHAHAGLIASEPADGAGLADPPAAISLTFNEPVRLLRLRLVDDAGREVALAPTVPTGEVLTARPPVPLPHGTYLLSWRVTSTDGHPVSGALGFGVGTTASTTAPPHGEAGQGLSPLRLVAEALRLPALLIPGGLALLLATGTAPVARAPIRRASLTAAAALILSAGLAGAGLAGAGLASLATAEPWEVVLATSVGRSALVGLAGLACILAAAGTAPRRRLPLAAAGVLTLGALLLTGHAASAPPAGLGLALVALHALPAALWLGALPLLRRRVRAGPPREAATALAGFSRWGQPAVLVLLAAGVGLALLQIRRPEAAWATTYGRLWLAKLALVLPLLGLALLNRHRLTPRLARGDSSAAGVALSRSIGAEIVFAAAILGLSAALAAVPPPRASLSSAPTAAAVPLVVPLAGDGGAGSGEAALDPGRPGRNRLRVRLAGPDGAPLAFGDAPRVELRHPALADGHLARALSPAADGSGAAEAEVDLPLAGPWRINVLAYPGPFDQARFTGEATLGSGVTPAPSAVPPEDGPAVDDGAHDHALH